MDMEALADLERIQTRILERITDLESSLLPGHFFDFLSISSPAADPSTTEGRLSAILRTNGVKDFIFKRVPSDYYDWPLEARRDVLGAASIHHLCKSIVLVNTQAPSHVIDCSDRNNSKYYVVVVQYTARFNAESVKNFLYELNNGQISKKKFNSTSYEELEYGSWIQDASNRLLSISAGEISTFLYHFFVPNVKVELGMPIQKFIRVRLAPEEISANLTGYEHNGVTCVGMKTDIPVILDEAIAKLNPDFFWLGGGDIDLKLGIKTSEFIDFAKPFIVKCSGT